MQHKQIISNFDPVVNFQFSMNIHVSMCECAWRVHNNIVEMEVTEGAFDFECMLLLAQVAARREYEISIGI